MSPAEKAKELVDKMTENFPFDYDIARRQAKQCAIICVDQIIMVTPAMRGDNIRIENYWQSVKQEIEKL